MLAAFMLATAATFAAPLSLYLSPTGDDAHAGTEAQPMRTLAAAHDRLREQRLSTAQEEAVVVWLGDGVYPLDAPMIWTTQDGGSAEAPVRFQAQHAGAARITGGDQLPTEAFTPVSDTALLARIPEEAHAAIRRVDLKSMGITEYGTLPDGFEGAPVLAELFFNDERMTLAQWPNEGWAEIERVVESGPAPWRNHESDALGRFVCKDDRLTRWKSAPELWLEGYWCFDWSCETIRVGAMNIETREITLAKQHHYGIGNGNPAPRRYRAVNLLEELDTAGEYFLDRQEGALYFWPPASLDGARVLLSRVTEPLLQFKELDHLSLQGITVECTQGVGIQVEGGSHVTLAGCTVRNTGLSGVQVQGGTHHTVQSCNIHDTGTGGLEIGGGDRKTLTPCHHVADNNHIHNVSRRMRTHAYNIHVSGVGVRMTHNLIKDAPHQGIGFAGNDHLFEFNEVANVGMASDDCGALYMGRNPSERGSIIRHNYWHHIGSEMGHGSCAIYFDDGAGGQIVEGNVFYKAAGGSFGAVFNHGGHDNTVVNNIFIDCPRAIGAAPWNAETWKSWLTGDTWRQWLLTDVDITSAPYTERYPQLLGFMESGQRLRLNHASRNIAVKCDTLATGNWEISDCVMTNEDPGFVDGQKENFQLREDAPVLQRVPGFVPIPMDRIGLYSDEYRSK